MKNLMTGGLGSAERPFRIAMLGVLATGLAWPAGSIAVAQEGNAWKPSRAIVVVPASPGGGSDVQGRRVAAGLEKVVDGLTAIVENRPGGSNVVGINYVFQQKGNPEYLLVTLGSLLTGPLTTKTPYTWKDFTPIAQVGEDSLFLVVKQEASYKSLQDLVASSKDKELVEAVVAATGPSAMASNLLQSAAGVKYRHVVFSSSGDANAALLAGDVEFLIANPSEIAGFVKANTLRPLAVFSEQRHAAFPDVPTAKEQGIDVVHGQWRGIVAPGDLDKAESEFWISALEKWSKTDDYKQYVESELMSPVIKTGEAFAAFLDEQNQIVQKVIQKPE